MSSASMAYDCCGKEGLAQPLVSTQHFKYEIGSCQTAAQFESFFSVDPVNHNF